MPGSFKNADEMREFAMSAAPVDLDDHLQEFGGLAHGHMSQKPEAGKWADKMRRITSAEELFREMWSEFETNIAFLLPTTASATLGRSKAAMDRQFRTMAAWTRDYRSTAIGNFDAASWSKRFPRIAFKRYVAYLANMFQGVKFPGGKKYPVESLSWLWDRFCLCVHKDGYHAAHHLGDGGVQGFPARADTTFHAMVLEYLRHVLEEKGLLSSTDRTYGSCLIDDAYFATRWADPLTEEESQRIAYWEDLLERYSLYSAEAAGKGRLQRVTAVRED